jgi:CAAX protease family protein
MITPTRVDSRQAAGGIWDAANDERRGAMNPGIPPRPDVGDDGPSGPPPASWRAIEALPVGLISIAALTIVEALAAAIFFSQASRTPATLQDDPGFFVFASYVLPVITLATVAFWIRVVNHGSLASLGLPPRRPWEDLGAGAVGAVAMVFGAGIVLQVTHVIVDAVAGHSVPNPDQVPVSVSGPLLLVSAVAIVILAPLAEETFFRGFLYRGLRRRLPVWPSALISAFFFGLVHSASGIRFFLIVPSLILVGLILALVYERRQSLLASVAAHAFFNLIGFVVIAHGR